MEHYWKICIAFGIFGTACVSAAQVGGQFEACPHFFAQGKAPVVPTRPQQRALCFDAFAVLHSGESKTPIFVAQRLTRKTVADAGERRSDKFYEEARLPALERARLEDYRNSGWSRGHMAPAGDMPTPEAMAQSFSLANMVPQAIKHNGGAWANTVENATRKYAARATGNVYVLTGPVFSPDIVNSPSIGQGRVRVPAYLFKLVFDEDRNRAWAHWHENADATKGTRPISYQELVKRTGIEFLPGLSPRQ